MEDGGERGAALGHGVGGSGRDGRGRSWGGVRRRRRGGNGRRRGQRQQKRRYVVVVPLLVRLLQLGLSQQAQLLRHRLVQRLHGQRGAGGSGESRLLARGGGVCLLLAGARGLGRPGGRSGDQTPAPHAADGPADEAGPASAVRGVGGVLTEQLEDSPQRKRRGLTKRKRNFFKLY